jgi:hypothetical protein
MGVYDDLAKLNTESPSLKSENVIYNRKASKRKSKRKPMKPVNRSIDQSTNQSTDRSTSRPIDQLTNIDSLGPVVERPRAFYITQKVDRWLDEGVRYLRKKGLHKVDRSVLVNAFLHDRKMFKPSQLDNLREKLLIHLTNKSLKRVESTD